MMKFALVLAFAALAMAGGPTCTTLVNGNFDDANTIAPWVNNSYNGGSSSCLEESFLSNNRCELLQSNTVTGNGAFLDNAGRISVGYPYTAECRPADMSAPAGVNVYQENIGMCRGITVTADVGYQDDSNLPGVTRVDQVFSLVVGRSEFDLLGGDQAVVATHTFPVPTDGNFNIFYQVGVSGIWSGPPRDSCSQICPNDNCYAVGVRYSRAAIVTSRVRGYIDNLVLVDEAAPSVMASDVSAQAASCSAAATAVSFAVTASDNCCDVVSLDYSWNDGGPQSTTGNSNAPGGASFPVGTTSVTVTATDSSGNTATDTFNVRIYEFEGSITCYDYTADVEGCWNEVPSSHTIADRVTCNSVGAITYTPDRDTYFPNGISTMTASYTQSNGVDGSYTISCDATIQLTLCCSANNKRSEAGRSDKATLRKLAKF